MRPWENACNILAIRLDAMGDVLMTGPAIRALAEQKPQSQVTLLTSPAGAQAGALLPGVDRLIVYDAPWMKATATRTSSQTDWAMIQQLRSSKFDAAVIFTVYSQNPLPAAITCFLADIPLRLAHCRENPYQLLTDWVPEREPEQGIRHEVKRQLDLVASIGCRSSDQRMRVKIPASARARIHQLLHGMDVLPGQPWAIVHPGATAPSRRYPGHLFARACRELTRIHGLRLFFTGNESERPLVEQIRKELEAPSESLVGALSLAEMAALLSSAHLLISNNTGPVHLAAAVGCPVVDLYALTNPQHTPWMVDHRLLNRDVPCRWCYKSICPEGHHLCLLGVEPAEVVQASLELLGPSREPAARGRPRLPVNS